MGTNTSTGNGISRRATLATLGGLAAGLAAASGAHAHPEPTRRRSIRLAHLTDFHVQPERAADQGMGACLDHVMAQKDRPELILTGGDLVMDTFEQEEPRTRLLWDMFVKRCRDHTSIPIEHCLGNHDIWGWNQRKSKTTGAEARWGKAWALDALGLPAPYRAFDRAGWRFIVLDSVRPLHGDGYTAHLDDEQFEWLGAELKATHAASKPALIVSHVPIFSVSALDDASRVRETDWSFPAALMHADAAKIMALLRAHPCVRLCLSGHIHRIDRTDYDGVTFICDGAVCGAWWRGRQKQCDEGYGLIDLYEDGTFEHQYQRYGWVAREG